MSWFTFVALIFILIMVFAGSKRGLVLEIFDLLWLIGAFSAASYAKGPMANFCIQRFHWGAAYAHNFIFILFFILTMVIIFFIGVLINDTLKTYIPDQMNMLFGGFAGLFKGIIILYIFVAFISLMNISESGRKDLHNDFVLQKIQNLTPAVANIIFTLTPEDAAQFYIKKIDKHKF